MFVMTTNQKGAVAELAIALEASRLGIGVLRPLVEGVRYDLVFDLRDRLARVQCKWANKKGDVIAVQTGGNYHSPTKGYVRSTYAAREVDAVAAYCAATGGCYYLPIEEVAGLAYIHLRLNPARNSQRAGIRMAQQFEFGAIAQLGERGHGMAEVVGSSPTGSTVDSGGRLIVRSQMFHRRFGWYAQRAANGEEVLVTRWGKPYVRVIPANDQLELEGGEIEAAQPS
jgi:hypothetical protein